MIASVLTATLLGLFAGLVPGPYTTMVAATGLERGFRAAVPIAMAPLITDVPPMLVASLVVRKLDWAALTLLGICGGVVVGMLGVRLLRAHGPLLPEQPGPTGGPISTGSVRAAHVLTMNLLNPAPWVFWFVAAAPLLLVHWYASPARGLAFVVVLFGVNLSAALGLAWVASHARGLIAPVSQRRALVAAGLALLGAGTLMVWQALEGNFQAMIEGQRAVRGVLAR